MRDAYVRLDRRIQKWIFQQGWTDLREIQAKAILPILAGDRDVLISASTAAGKTEAFFLPACSAIADQMQGFGILYISPLKALINDQYRRLEGLCDLLDMPLTPWHGDALTSRKKRAKNNPSGILLITPESLESLFVREAGWAKRAFSSLRYICIDEFHAFIGTERGQHLLSLLTRLEHLTGRLTKPIPRVALSATLGQLETVPPLLRPNASLACDIIESSQGGNQLKVQVKGYIEPVDVTKNKALVSAEYRVCQEIYQRCHGGSHLVFANSRQRTERIAAKLTGFSEQHHVPNEFFPHHGSLAKELREELETRLQRETIPTTAICTMTLELGIDIGKVNSVIQVTAPHSVSSLRQRLGRSGRRNNPAILRILIAENELNTRSNITDHLRLELVQSLAMIRLLINSKWFEPADTRQMHLSTVLHQILAITAQWGSIRVEQLYTLLCDQGPFKEITVQHFKQLLSHMGKTQLLQQLNSGELVLGLEGERLVNAYTFYAVFKTPEEYRLINGYKTLGTLPIENPILQYQHIVFGGKYWQVTDLDEDKKVIHVKPAKGGEAPKFNGNGLAVHDVVRQEMYKIYASGDYRIPVNKQKIDFADDVARELFREGASYFKNANLANQFILQNGKHCYLFPWMGDKVVNTLAILLMQQGFTTSSYGGVVEIQDAEVNKVADDLISMVKHGLPNETELADMLSESQKHIEKYDEYIPKSLLSEGYGRKTFDCMAAKKWILGNL